MAALVTIFWICLAAFVIWRIWSRFHEAPPFDPDNPPDLRNFSPPQSDQESGESPGVEHDKEPTQ